MQAKKKPLGSGLGKTSVRYISYTVNCGQRSSKRIAVPRRDNAVTTGWGSGNQSLLSLGQPKHIIRCLDILQDFLYTGQRLLARQNGNHREKTQLNIEPDELVFDIEQAEHTFARTNKLVVGDVRVCLIFQNVTLVRKHDGKNVGDAGLDSQQLSLDRCVKIGFAFDIWTWSDQTHVALENVPQLGQFIELVTPDEVANRRDPVVIFTCRVHA